MHWTEELEKLQELLSTGLLTRQEFDLHKKRILDGRWASKNAALATQSTESSISFRPGMEIGQYRLLSKLGEGRMGVVFLARYRKEDFVFLFCDS